MLFIIVLAVTLSYHAVVTHGDEAVAVKNCIENGGTIQKWHTQDTKITVCLMEGTRAKGKFGLFFEKISNPENNTAFTKGDSLWKVVDYLKRMGAKYE
jgi:putative hemolysin